MDTYKVTVCRLGYMTVQADSEEEAKQKVSRLPPEQIHWLGPSEQVPPFLITYAEEIRG